MIPFIIACFVNPTMLQLEKKEVSYHQGFISLIFVIVIISSEKEQNNLILVAVILLKIKLN